MNSNSYLCQLMKGYPLSWRAVLSSKGVNVVDDGDLSIIYYLPTCTTFTDPEVQEARGIIINTKTLEVVCWPFRKFGNYGEPYADKIDWLTARVQTKIDGSLVKLWFNELTQSWQWSTNHAIDAHKVITHDSISFYDMIVRAYSYKKIRWDLLHKDTTYMFELVGPDNRIVIDYPVTDLYHIGTRNNITGRESVASIGVQHPEEYPLHSLDACIRAAEALNPIEGEIDQEGFVVVDANWNRNKVKSPAYFAIHRVMPTKVLTKDAAIDLLRSKSLDEVLKLNPHNQIAVYYYKYRWEELLSRIHQEVYFARRVFEDMGHDRKASAELIKKSDLPAIGFMALDMDEAHVLAHLETSQLIKLIPDYSKQ